MTGFCLLLGAGFNSVGGTPGARQFHKEIEPLLSEFCFDCHGDGMKKGEVAFDEFESDAAVLENRELWAKALKNLRAGMMPPAKKSQPTADQKGLIENWIKTAVFESDPRNPDPGRVTVRRLNRVEYRNTIRDLMGIDFNTENEFPPDDTGHGFDNIGDVLTLSPMLLEKYLAAAKSVVSKAVPTAPRVPREKAVPGKKFEGGGTNSSSQNWVSLSYYEPAAVSNVFRADHPGRYQLLVDLTASERFVDNQFDYNKCQLIFKADGEELLRQEYNREGGKSFHYEFDRKWVAGDHVLTFEIAPLTPEGKRVRSLSLRIDSVTVRGPLEEQHWVRPKNFERFFTRDAPGEDAARLDYARTLLRDFATKAFRRPVESKTVNRLAGLAESVYSQPGKTFEAGIAHAMVAVLASPRFLFREEGTETMGGPNRFPYVDEYSLASRLSYFLWSSMPDEELFRLAKEKKLRKNLDVQVQRLLADKRSDALVKNFTGQWLQARDIDTVQIDARQVLQREAAPDPDRERRRRRSQELREKGEDKLTTEEKAELEELRAAFRRGFRAPRAELTGDLRRAMRQETEKTFEYVLKQDRSLLELLDSDYTFLNEKLAKHYGITNVTGDEMRLVSLPDDSPRGGILTQGTTLAVTSNPTRTSPVKRGLFVLENVLGTPPPPPPPDIPPLEDANKVITNRTPTLRETLAVHRDQPLCASCHNRMDPLGLGLENFNAMGMWREKERDQPIDATARLITGEEFKTVKELKRILVTQHQADFYRTLTEKLLTYALGRGLEYYDVETVDQIVARLLKENGRPAALLAGIIESAPFQKTRKANAAETSKPTRPVEQRADAKTRL
jgi:hypothetical protein